MNDTTRTTSDESYDVETDIQSNTPLAQFVSLANPDESAVPPGPEITKSDRQSSEILPPSSTSVKLEPAGTDEPVKENPSTVAALAETVNPAPAASPPDALVTHPL